VPRHGSFLHGQPRGAGRRCRGNQAGYPARGDLARVKRPWFRAGYRRYRQAPAGAGDIFIADGAQTAGLVPLDLGKLPVDAFVFTGHKYLFGFPGTGGFYLRDPARILPTRQGGTGTDSKNPFQPEGMPERFEAGTHNYPGLVSLAAGIAFLEQTGADAVTRCIHKQTAIFLEEFLATDAITVYNPAPELPVISFTIRGLGNDDAGFVLRKMYGIVTRTGLHCAPLIHERIDGGSGCIRISPSVLTPRVDCRRAAECIREVADRANSR